MKKVAIIDDDKEFLNRFQDLFSHAFEISIFDSPLLFLEEIDSETISEFSLIIIDMEMTELDGLSLILKIKENYLNSPPMIVLTNYDTSHNRISIYSNQVYDLINKGSLPDEILTRLKNAIQLSELHIPHSVNINGLKYNEETLGFTFRGKTLELTQLETRILYYLTVKANLPVKRDDVIDTVWSGKKVSPQTLRTHLYNLNLKLEEIGISYSINALGDITLKDLN